MSVVGLLQLYQRRDSDGEEKSDSMLQKQAEKAKSEEMPLNIRKGSKPQRINSKQARMAGPIDSPNHAVFETAVVNPETGFTPNGTETSAGP